MKLNSSLLVIPADVRLRHEGFRHRVSSSPIDGRIDGRRSPAAASERRREQALEKQHRGSRVQSRHSLTREYPSHGKDKSPSSHVYEKPIDPGGGGLQSSTWSMRPSYGTSVQMSEALESLCFLRGLDELEHLRDLLRMKHEGRLRVLAAGLSGSTYVGNKLHSPRPSTPPNTRRGSPLDHILRRERYRLGSTSSSSSSSGSRSALTPVQNLIEVVAESPPAGRQSPLRRSPSLSPDRGSVESVRFAPMESIRSNGERRHGHPSNRRRGGSELPIIITPTTQTDTPRRSSWLEEISTSYLTKGRSTLEDSPSRSSQTHPGGPHGGQTGGPNMTLNDTTNALAGSFNASSRMTDFNYSMDSRLIREEASSDSQSDSSNENEFLSVLEKRTGYLAKGIEQFATRH
eukprot:Protomagalhaensia_wolfi_Nauph_80__1483@NODE_189_length_3241_cov_56_850094_g142_i0_p1_GENE_NODE_189_length_3241_cov_56_850094_g142_i0NODE_189_length_3241_cov_56_850094_g142_i0_p1_ORF_typecomplete_len403_score68_84_NODE_189_length_3241_cov_56_850094_g142_i07901998